MMSDFKISVVIPALNCEATLARAVNSCVNQTYAPFEIIVVDNGSSDKTIEVAKTLPVKLIHESRRGASHARNTGIKFSTGELVTFLDADDAWLPNKLERVAPAFMNPNIALVAHNFLVNEKVFDCFAARHRLANDFASLLLGNYIATSTAVARRSALFRAGLFPEWLKVAEDYWLWLAIARREKVYLVSDALTQRYNSPTSLTARYPTKTKRLGYMVSILFSLHLLYRPAALYQIIEFFFKKLSAKVSR